MHFLRTLFWVVVAIFLTILARNNWSDVTVNLWGGLQLDTKVPLLVLLGFLPTYLILRGRIWVLKRQLAAHERSTVPVSNPPAAAPASTGTLDPA